MAPRTIDLGMEIDGTDLTVTVSYSPGTSDYWDRSYGCWMPGDPSDVEILEIVEDDSETLRPDLLAEVEKRIDKPLARAIDQGDLDDEPRYDTMEEARGEA